MPYGASPDLDAHGVSGGGQGGGLNCEGPQAHDARLFAHCFNCYRAWPKIGT